MTTPVRIALCGLGLMGKAHLEVMRQNPQVVLACIVDPSATSKELACEMGVTHFEQLQSALDAGNLDGVIVATPNAMHVPQAVQCLRAGIGVLVEKPIADQLCEAHELVKMSEQTAVPVLIGHHRSHSSIMRRASSLVQSGALGRLVSFQGSATFAKPNGYFEQGPWRRKPGGGPLLINMIHEVHNMQMLCGRIKSVQALSSNFIRGFEVEDTVCIGLSFDSGALGTFMLSDCAASPLSWEQTSAENKAYAHYPRMDCYHLSGTQGTLSIPTLTLHRFNEKVSPSWLEPMQVEQLPLEPLDPLAEQLAHFVQVIKRETPALVSAQMGLDNFVAVNAIIESAKTGQRIVL